MSFLNQVIENTRESNKKYKLERAEYDRASNVLYDIAERKLKKCVLQRANDGYTDATFDVINDLKLDIAGKWSIPELLFAIIFEDAPPVVSRLFYLSNSPFAGFSISSHVKSTGPSSVFVIDWAYQMLQAPAKPQPAPVAKPQPAPVARMLDYDMTQESNNFLTAITGVQENIYQKTTPPKPLVPTPPGAPVKPNNPVARNISEETSIPPLTEQQIAGYMRALYSW